MKAKVALLSVPMSFSEIQKNKKVYEHPDTWFGSDSFLRLMQYEICVCVLAELKTLVTDLDSDRHLSIVDNYLSKLGE